MTVHADHVATVEALRPGVVEVIEENGSQGKKWFGGCFCFYTLPGRTSNVQSGLGVGSLRA